jgi:glycosyltransferase involved in cell wall biosynthesis
VELLLLCEYATLNGGEQSMLSTLEHVGRAGFSIRALAPPSGPLADALRLRQIEVEPFSVRDPAGAALPRPQVREALAELLRRRRVDLLHANSLAMGRLAGPVAAELGLRSIAHLRDIVRVSRQAIADLNRHTRLLAVSQATRDYHVAAGLCAAKTHVLYNGVDLARFAPRPASGDLHRELGLSPDAPLVGAIGQIGLRKGHDVLVEAAIRLARRPESSCRSIKPTHGNGWVLPDGRDSWQREPAPRLPEVHYLIVGGRFSDKAESRAFERRLHAAAEGRLQGRLHLLGVRGDVERILNELTLLVHPARQEPLSRVLLEAAACGVTVIASDVGGTREIFPPESNSARLVPPDDPAGLAEALAELLGDAPLRARLSASARRRAEAAFDIRTAAVGLVEHYQQALAE